MKKKVENKAPENTPFAPAFTVEDLIQALPALVGLGYSYRKAIQGATGLALTRGYLPGLDKPITVVTAVLDPNATTQSWGEAIPLAIVVTEEIAEKFVASQPDSDLDEDALDFYRRFITYEVAQAEAALILIESAARNREREASEHTIPFPPAKDYVQ